ncbi:tartrate-resistant acid phosphatase type 5-like [Dendronephthya gigantea]|uniref:tartrate-resistant acid phosphatase type 5-like n=1 Tax=Dendronephthya gigantea TaxID=151771 RepID=UPI00106A2046|nr:tartrate-resistant acid phosphatase type 5-like [Dendronephthya gigantea]
MSDLSLFVLNFWLFYTSEKYERLTMSVGYFFIATLLALIFLGSVQTKKGQLRFVVLGDFGGMPTRPYYTSAQWRIAKHVAKIPNLDFFVSAGDNFYYNGVKDVNDFRFYATYERVYNEPSFQKNWYVIAGNHDYDGNVSAQILYTQKSKRWMFPHFYHTKKFFIPETNKSLQIVMIDTTILCFRSGKKKYKNTPSVEEQMTWIRNTLNESKAHFLIVIGHHPIYSSGRHGSSKCLQDKLLDLFKQHKVNAYISGHDHNLQHIVPPNSSLEYFICGAANFFNWIKSKPGLEPNSLKYFVGNLPGFLLVTAKEDRLKLELRTATPKQKYKRFLPPRNKLPDSSEQPQKYPKLLEKFFASLPNG